MSTHVPCCRHRPAQVVRRAARCCATSTSPSSPAPSPCSSARPGSGKTTVLRSLNVLEVPDGGIVRIDDVEVDFAQARGRRDAERDFARLRRQSAMVFQAHHLFPHRTVLREPHRGPDPRAGRAGGEVVAEARVLLEQVGLADREDAYPEPALRRPAAARRHRPGARAEAQADALRRAHLGPRPRAGRRGARRDEGPRRRGLDDGRGDPRDPVRPAGRRPGALPRPGRHRRARPGLPGASATRRSRARGSSSSGSSIPSSGL